MPLKRAAHLTGARLAVTVAVLATLLLLSMAVAILLGPVHVRLAAALADPGSADHEILVYARLPRVLLAAVVGAALGGAGSVLQGMLGNPLADPNLLGVSAGAAVAGAIAIVAGADPVSMLVPWCAFAAALGVDVDRVRRSVFVLSSLLIGAAVSVSGMINFVGLIVPHLLRLVVGPDQRVLLPASVLGGAVFLVCADTAARTVLAPAELPVGEVTALLGGPFFLFLLRRSLRGAQ
jgi:iron complex transport system permease protein